MRFPAVANSTIRSAQWIAASDMAIAAWTKLCFRASEDENGGRFGGASTWSESIWLPMANVTKAGIDAAVSAGLCSWEGDALIVNGYDRGSDKKLATMRKNGTKGGRPRKPNGKPNGFHDAKPNPKPLSSPSPSLPVLTLPNPSPYGEGEQKTPAAPAPTGQSFIAVFVEEWQLGYRGESYEVVPADAGAAKQLAEKKPHLFPKWRDMCRRFVGSPKAFYAESRHPLHLMARAINEWTGEVRATSPPNGRGAKSEGNVEMLKGWLEGT